MNIKLLQQEDYHSYIEHYQKNQDRIELLHKEIDKWEEKFGGMSSVPFDKEPSKNSYNKDGLTPIQREAMYRIEQCYMDIDECGRKMKIVDDLINYLEEMGDEIEKKIIESRIQQIYWYNIPQIVNYSQTNCVVLYWKAIDSYMNHVRRVTLE